MKSNSVLYLALLLAMLFALLNLAFNDHLGSDTGNYYSRMADEFAQGNYKSAFFHLIPPLTPFLAGLAATTGLDGWTAMKLVSSLFFLASVYWCYRLARLRLSDVQAQWCALLFVLCSRLLRYGMGGQLDAAKTFLLLLVFEQFFVYLKTRHWRQLLSISIGSAALVLARNEGIGYLMLVLGLLFIADWLMYGKVAPFLKSVSHGVLRCLFVLGFCLVVWFPWISYQYSVTGYPVLSSKHIAIVGKLLPWVDVESSTFMQELRKGGKEVQQYYTLEAPAEQLGESKKNIVERFKDAQPGSAPFKLVETLNGVYPRYLIFALIGVVSLLRRKEWCQMDSLLTLILTFHIAVYWLLSPNILQRLIIPGIPFYFPWMVVGGLAIARTFKIDWNKKVHQRILITLVVVIGVVQVSSGMSSVRKSLRGKDRLEVEISQWIEENRADLDTHQAPPLESGIHPRAYQTGRQPVVLSFMAVACRSKSDAMLQDRVPDITHEQFVDLCIEKRLDVIVADRKFIKGFSMFNSQDPRFQIAERRWEDEGVLIYTFNPKYSASENR